MRIWPLRRTLAPGTQTRPDGLYLEHDQAPAAAEEVPAAPVAGRWEPREDSEYDLGDVIADKPAAAVDGGPPSWMPGLQMVAIARPEVVGRAYTAVEKLVIENYELQQQLADVTAERDDQAAINSELRMQNGRLRTRIDGLELTVKALGGHAPASA